MFLKGIVYLDKCEVRPLINFGEIKFGIEVQRIDQKKKLVICLPDEKTHAKWMELIEKHIKQQNTKRL